MDDLGGDVDSPGFDEPHFGHFWGVCNRAEIECIPGEEDEATQTQDHEAGYKPPVARRLHCSAGYATFSDVPGAGVDDQVTPTTATNLSPRETRPL